MNITLSPHTQAYFPVQLHSTTSSSSRVKKNTSAVNVVRTSRGVSRTVRRSPTLGNIVDSVEEPGKQSSRYV